MTCVIFHPYKMMIKMIKFVQKGIFKNLFDFDGLPNRSYDEDSPGVRPYPADWALDSP